MITQDLLLIKASVFIEELEGFKEYAYLDSTGIWTYGIGFTRTPNGNKVKQFDRISKNDSINFLKNILLSDFHQLQNLVRVPQNEYQWIALLSFVYNVGLTRFRRSPLLSKINKQDSKENISFEFSRWVYANGQLIRGLKNRRNKEITKYFYSETGKLDL
jgi:lysozyme